MQFISSIVVVVVAVSVVSAFVTQPSLKAFTTKKSSLMMSDQVLAAQPTIEEWLYVCDPGLRKATMGKY